MELLSQQEINRRLHLFNLSVPRDWSLFDGVPDSQQICFMYPEVMFPVGTSDDERKQRLIDMFGPIEEC